MAIHQRTSQDCLLGVIGGITIGLRIQIEIHKEFRGRDHRKIGIVIGTDLSVARAKF